MFDHVRVDKENAASKLRIVKRLARTGWGAKASVLRTLYLGAVRSQMDRCKSTPPKQLWRHWTMYKIMPSV